MALPGSLGITVPSVDDCSRTAPPPAPSGVAGMDRNQWLACVGITGWNGSVSPAALRRNTHSGFAIVVDLPGGARVEPDGKRAVDFGHCDAEGAAVIPVPANVRVWIATGHTDMRRGMTGLALQVQEILKRDPHAGDIYLFRGKRGDLMKCLWHDGLGLSLYAKRLDRGRFIWPSSDGGSVAITPAQMGYLLEAIDWRNPQQTWRPTSAG